MSDGATHTAPDSRTLAVEHALHVIEAELGHRLELVQRIGIERALERLADDAAGRAQWQPWC